MGEEKKIRNAIKDFFIIEYKKLINYVHRYISEVYYGIDAEDIIQDVALSIYTKADINAPIENLTGYVYRSVRNKIIDIQRKHRNTTSIENFNTGKHENDLIDTIPDDNEEEELYNNDEFQIKMVDAIEQLKPEQKAVIIETEYNGKSFNELANEWDTPIGTLLARKHRALGVLQKILHKDIMKYKQ